MPKYRNPRTVDITELQKYARDFVALARGRDVECLKECCKIPNVGDPDLNFSVLVKRFGAERASRMKSMIHESVKAWKLDPNLLQIAILAEFVK